MQGKVVVVTGATSGIGQVAAERLAAMGARLIVVARDRARGEAVVAVLKRVGPGTAHGFRLADLSLMTETRRLAAEIAAAEPRIDVLVNNAGALFAARQVTAEGLERTFGTNHMAYFLLTLGLAESLRAAAPARVINTASDAHRGEALDFSDLQSSRGYRGVRAYGRSKLANILFTRELARRWCGTGVTANCLHPGFVATRFGDGSGGWLSYGVRLAKVFAISPRKGAETIVHLAASPKVAEVSGEYFYQCRPTIPSVAARDDAAAQRLWTESERLGRGSPPT
jgi:NAD(P)-dependent dehydrogenase (short-subunit alcohol dehydrogenase family)